MKLEPQKLNRRLINDLYDIDLQMLETYEAYVNGDKELDFYSKAFREIVISFEKASEHIKVKVEREDRIARLPKLLALGERLFCMIDDFFDFVRELKSMRASK